MKTTRTSVGLCLCAGAALFAGAARAQMGDPAKVTLKTTPVAGGISMIEGANGFAGGNVAVTVGEDGVFVVDDELAPLTPKLKAALAALSKAPVRFVVNTHWHGDHTGGNLGLAAAGAVIVAQDNARKRMSTDQFFLMAGGQKHPVPASPKAALPVVTFSEDITLHLNGDDVRVVHLPPSHTDGDAIVHFKKANVIHAGDTVTASYPIVDVANGGQFEGFIGASERIMALCDDTTKVIPGHGPVMTKADLAARHQMLLQLRDRIGKLIAAGKSLDEIKAAKPLADLDSKWGQGPIKTDDAIEMIYISRPPAPPAKGPVKEKGK
jgi:cyclase